MALQQIKVKNTTQGDIYRGNRKFPALKTTTIVIDTENNKFKEIKACVGLKVVAAVDYPVVKKVTEDSKVEDTKTATKEVVTPTTDVVDDKETTDEVTTDVVEDLESADEDTDNEEQEETTDETSDDEEEQPTIDDGRVACPYCDFIGTKQGMYHHVRVKHPDNYEEFKERAKNL